MGSAWQVMGNFLKVCLPSGVLEALIVADWRRGCGSGGGWREERQQEEGGVLPGLGFSSVAAKADVISVRVRKGKRTHGRRRGRRLHSGWSLAVTCAAMTDGAVDEMDQNCNLEEEG